MRVKGQPRIRVGPEYQVQDLPTPSPVPRSGAAVREHLAAAPRDSDANTKREAEPVASEVLQAADPEKRAKLEASARV
jgi:hypothetical protein